MYPKGYEITASFELDMSEWGNAVPYTSQAHEAKGSRKHGQVKRYKVYKHWLAWTLASLKIADPRIKDIKQPKKGEKVYLYVHIYFRDYTHGDPENVRKAIQDAIYGQDKYVAGCVDFGYDKERPRVVITILEREREG